MGEFLGFPKGKLKFQKAGPQDGAGFLVARFPHPIPIGGILESKLRGWDRVMSSPEVESHKGVPKVTQSCMLHKALKFPVGSVPALFACKETFNECLAVAVEMTHGNVYNKWGSGMQTKVTRMLRAGLLVQGYFNEGYQSARTRVQDNRNVVVRRASDLFGAIFALNVDGTQQENVPGRSCLNISEDHEFVVPATGITLGQLALFMAIKLIVYSRLGEAFTTPQVSLLAAEIIPYLENIWGRKQELDDLAAKHSYNSILECPVHLRATLVEGLKKENTESYLRYLVSPFASFEHYTAECW